MKRFLLLCIVVFNSIAGYCQLKQIAISKVLSQQAKGLRCIDSSGIISEHCSLDLDGFSIRLYAAYFDNNIKEMRLIGRVCMSDIMSSAGISDIEIFKAQAKDKKIIDKTLIGRTSFDKQYINNDGFFDITLTVNKNESLFFYGTGYFLKEFTVFKLL